MAWLRRSTSARTSSESPRRTWRAVLLGSLLLVPSFWSILAGAVASGSDAPEAPAPGPFLAFGLALVPFVFVVVAFASLHPRAPGAVLRAMGLALAVGIPVSALAADVVTGLVAGMGAGGAVALRADHDRPGRARAIAVAAASAYVYVMVRVAGDVTLVLAPSLPFTVVALADHLAVLWRERQPGADRPPGA